MFGFRYGQGRGILIDTPGFDDTSRSDAEILKEVAACFCNLYDKGIKLNGIVYLHRISDPRMGGSALKNLNMFQRLCGKPSLPNVILATTMWGEVQRQSGSIAAGERREDQLKSTNEFWGGMLRAGSHYRRHTGDRKSAEEIMSVIINTRRKTTLDIQIEMVDKKLLLDETTAGRYLKQEYAALRHKYEVETEELQKSKELAIQDKDEEMFTILKEEQLKAAAEIAKAKTEDKKLKLDFNRLRDEKKYSFQRTPAINGDVEMGDLAIDPTGMLNQTIDELRQSIERQEEEHKSQMLRQQRQLTAKATTVSADNQALAQIVQRLAQDKKELERLLHSRQVRRPDTPPQHRGGSHRDKRVLQKRAPPQPPQQQQNYAQSAAAYAWEFRKYIWT
jgi:hypothetical protein